MGSRNLKKGSRFSGGRSFSSDITPALSLSAVAPEERFRIPYLSARSGAQLVRNCKDTGRARPASRVHSFFASTPPSPLDTACPTESLATHCKQTIGVTPTRHWRWALAAPFFASKTSAHGPILSRNSAYPSPSLSRAERGVSLRFPLDSNSPSDASPCS